MKVTVDICILCHIFDEPHILLIRRKNDPYKGFLALPGGFVEENETLLEAAKRELQEETSLTNVNLEQIMILDDPHRDERSRVISIVYFGTVPYTEVTAGDDATEADWYILYDIKSIHLAFDHSKVLEHLKWVYHMS